MCAPAAWLAGVARNVVAHHVRRRVREVQTVGKRRRAALLDEQSIEQLADRIDGERASREPCEVVPAGD